MGLLQLHGGASSSSMQRATYFLYCPKDSCIAHQNNYHVPLTEITTPHSANTNTCNSNNLDDGNNNTCKLMCAFCGTCVLQCENCYSLIGGDMVDNFCGDELWYVLVLKCTCIHTRARIHTHTRARIHTRTRAHT